nr:MAG TPA: hypothetical protein [Caudoviricetes sp.]
MNERHKISYIFRLFLYINLSYRCNKPIENFHVKIYKAVFYIKVNL